MANMLGILVTQIHSRTYCIYFVFLELVDVMGEIVPTYPYLPEPVFSWQDSLTFVIKLPEEHLNYTSRKYQSFKGIFLILIFMIMNPLAGGIDFGFEFCSLCPYGYWFLRVIGFRSHHFVLFLFLLF